MSINKNNVQNENSKNSSFSKLLEIQDLNHKPLKRSQFLKNISQSFNDPKYSDLKITIEGKHIYVPKYGVHRFGEFLFGENRFGENIKMLFTCDL